MVHQLGDGVQHRPTRAGHARDIGADGGAAEQLQHAAIRLRILELDAARVIGLEQRPHEFVRLGVVHRHGGQGTGLHQEPLPRIRHNAQLQADLVRVEFLRVQHANGSVPLVQGAHDGVIAYHADIGELRHRGHGPIVGRAEQQIGAHRVPVHYLRGLRHAGQGPHSAAIAQGSGRLELKPAQLGQLSKEPH